MLMLNPSPLQEETGPPVRPGPTSMHCVRAEWCPLLEEKMKEKETSARYQAGQLPSDCKPLQDSTDTRMQRTHYSPGTVKSKKLAKGSQTKWSTCSTNFWALAWELDHVAHRTIIRKGVSRRIIKESRAYQALSCRCITCHKRCQEKFRIVVKKCCQNSCPNTFNNKICVHDKHVWQFSFLDTTRCFEETLDADRSAFYISWCRLKGKK